MALTQTRNRRRRDPAERKEALAAASGRFFARALKVALPLAALAAVSGGAHAAWKWSTTSSAFALREVKVEGHARATPTDLVRLSGAALGQNLLALDPDALERAIAAHPWVRTASVTRQPPDTLIIRIEEHQPLALLSLGELYLVDAHGEPFKRLQADDAVDLPLVTGVDRDAYVADPRGVAARLREGLSVLAAWNARGARLGPLSELRLDGEGLTLVSGAGEEIRLGRADHEQKLARLERVRAELAARRVQAEVIHLDNRARPGWVAVKLSSPVSERSRGR